MFVSRGVFLRDAGISRARRQLGRLDPVDTLRKLAGIFIRSRFV